jgi:hypothetical protein
VPLCGFAQRNTPLEGCPNELGRCRGGLSRAKGELCPARAWWQSAVAFRWANDQERRFATAVKYSSGRLSRFAVRCSPVSHGEACDCGRILTSRAPRRGLRFASRLSLGSPHLPSAWHDEPAVRSHASCRGNGRQRLVRSQLPCPICSVDAAPVPILNLIMSPGTPIHWQTPVPIRNHSMEPCSRRRGTIRSSCPSNCPG